MKNEHPFLNDRLNDGQRARRDFLRHLLATGALAAGAGTFSQAGHAAGFAGALGYSPEYPAISKPSNM